MDNFIDLTGKRFLITGATSGIGLEICKQIDQFNGCIVAIGRDQNKLKTLASMLKNKGEFVGLLHNLEDLENRKGLHEKLVSTFDGFIHAAGMVQILPVKFFNQIIQDQIRKVNYDSAVDIISYLLKQKKMNPTSSIVLISSIAGSFGMKGNLMYSSTKASLDIFAKILSAEVSKIKIRVNTICPGQIESEMTEKISKTLSNETINLDKQKYPLGYGSPIDVANLALFLLSDRSKWITGSNIIIDGGRSSTL
jgi:NAD(P)-dependent dehydrogenase (short-subunit alcohol dehydrogenase family)